MTTVIHRRWDGLPKGFYLRRISPKTCSITGYLNPRGGWGAARNAVRHVSLLSAHRAAAEFRAGTVEIVFNHGGAK